MKIWYVKLNELPGPLIFLMLSCYWIVGFLGGEREQGKSIHNCD